MKSSRHFLKSVTLSFSLLATGLTACDSSNQPLQTITQTEKELRVLGIQGQRNFRDIGGYETEDGRSIKWSRIYRSGKLSDLTPGDLETLSELNVDLVIDLRSDSEREEEPSKWQDRDTQFLDLPIGGTAADWSSKLSVQLQSGDFTESEIRNTFIDAYRQIPIDNTAEYRFFFDEILAQKDGAIVFHCTSGKDRTGIGAAFLLAALGVPREIIMQDYLLTNDVAGVDRGLPFIAKAFSQRSGREIDPESLRPLVGVEPIYLETTFDIVESQFGSMDAYLEQALGLTDSKRAKLRSLLLE